MANLRETQKLMTRRLLLDHGLALFRAKGYAAATVDEIAASAGTTRTTFYLHFPSKAQLMQALLDEVIEKLIGIDDPPLAEVVERGERPLVEEWLNRKFDQWPPIAPYLTAAYQAAAIEPEINAALTKWFDSTTSAMHDGLNQADRFDANTRHVRSMLAFGQFEYVARRWFESGWTFDRATTLTTITDSWCHLLIDVKHA
ncbi:TetR/AcrR family transcriptional regulator [Actinoplanes sp. CA-015351]|uniref:TetR/AcrR family transcriptional regulator n=1 Tax=Actinoplanes sp. CA-015351 TaxID=3239897 RepID=UPI003D9518F3